MTQTILDTFDWALHRHGWVLLADAHTVQLYPTDRWEVAGMVQTAVPPTFIWDFPPGPLHDLLAPVLDVRALLPQTAVPAATTAPTPADLTIHLTIHHPQPPGHYQAKPQLLLQPEMPTEMAVRQLLLADLQVMLINTPYIAQEIDTEFLHDFRVALRRSRALLAQLGHAFPADAVDQHKAALRQMQQETNALRDMDVYMLAEPAYTQLLPPLLQPHIAPLFAYLRQKRTAVLQETAVYLQSPLHQQRITAWQTFLEQPATAHPTAQQPIIQQAGQRILKRHKRMVRKGQSLLQMPNDALMHPLRIEGKKLRYLLELFASLYPTEALAQLAAPLKLVQTHLGNFHDYEVQEAHLLQLAPELPRRASKDYHLLLAIGALMAELHTQREAARAAFATTFTEFDTPENGRLYHQLFA